MIQPAPQGKSFDWEQAKARLARAAAIVDSDNLPEEQAKAILDERARKLARTPQQQPDASEVMELVTFRLGGDRFGIDARFVHELIRIEHITPVPDVPDFLFGTTNLRGEVLAVLDIRGFFGLSGTSAHIASAALVLGESQIEFALIADEVEEVATFRMTDFFHSTVAIGASGRAWVRGISQNALILLDARALLTDPRLFIDEV